MKQLIAAVLFGVVFSIPTVTSQTNGFSQTGKVTHELRDEGFSIAHSSLPLNSKAKIVNMSTGKEVEVTVTRFIPASPNRIADVSSGVWQELRLTPDTYARISAIVSTAPQTTAAPTIASPATKQQVPVANPQGDATKTAQAETPAFGNMPSSVKFDNDFIVNGNPVPPPAVAYETRTQTGGTQPAAAYDTRPQQAPSAVAYETRPQQAPSAVAYNTRPQQAPSAAAYETRPQQAPSAAAYNTRPQQAQPVVKIENSGGWVQLSAPYGTRPQQAPVNQAVKNPLPQENKSPSFNEILAPASKTFVFIDTPSHTPRPSVIIDNWPQSQGRDRN